MARQAEKMIPIIWEDWDSLDTFAIQYIDVQFVEDWGPYKKGQKIHCLVFNMECGYVAEYDVEGKELLKIDVVMSPKV